MKITYPECQIDISVEEVITLIDHVNKGSRPMTVAEMAEELLKPQGTIGPDFDPMFPIVKVPHVPELEEDPIPGPEPEPKPKEKIPQVKKAKKKTKLADIPFRMGKVERDDEPVEKPKRKSSGNGKAVQVLFDNGWKTYKTISKAAEAIGTKLNHLSHALLNGKTCNGHQVRYAVDIKEQPETTNEEPTEYPRRNNQ